MHPDAPMPAFDALDACHRDIAHHLADLQSLARHLEEAGIDARARSEARRIEAFFSGTSRKHHADEEVGVFPPLLASGDPELVQAVRRLQQDHGWLEEDWLELELQAYIQVFGDLLLGHIALEESLIYPASRARWDPLLARRRDAVPA